ncbi:hypothetical protein HPB50_029186 [Hyalomma asiaticum]|nr:hypothetical protein HPB50_029186 [Hyalomma asiaticum]
MKMTKKISRLIIAEGQEGHKKGTTVVEKRPWKTTVGRGERYNEITTLARMMSRPIGAGGQEGRREAMTLIKEGSCPVVAEGQDSLAEVTRVTETPHPIGLGQGRTIERRPT